MEIEHRTFQIECRVENRADSPPKIVGHAAVFNQLSENLGGFREQVSPGAFAESIKEDDIRALFNHDPNIILGRNVAGTLRLKEDREGLAIEIDPPDTQAARDLMVSMERGDISQMSFGFRVKPNGDQWAENDEGVIIRTLTNVKLQDVSPVSFPAYPQTDVAKRSLDEFKNSQKKTPLSIYRRKLELAELA